MTRFFAHLALFLRMIDVPTPPLATQVILEAYLQVLEVVLDPQANMSQRLTCTLFLGCWPARPHCDVRGCPW